MLQLQDAREEWVAHLLQKAKVQENLDNSNNKSTSIFKSDYILTISLESHQLSPHVKSM